MALIEDSERHELYLARLTTGLLNAKVYPSLEAAYKAARAILLDAENITSIKQLETIQSRIDKQVRKEYGKGLDELTEGLTDMAVYEAGYSAQLIGSYAAVELSVPGKTAIQKFIDQSLLTLTSGNRVNSGKWSEYVLGSVDAMAKQYNGIVATGYQQGLTVNQIAKQIKDSTQGLLKGQAEALARTGQSHYATQAREAMAIENKSVIKYRMFNAIYDNRTSLVCRGNNGKIYDITDDTYPRIPLHFGCRSVYTFLTSKDDAKRGTMSAVGGKEEDINPNRKLKYRGKRDKDIFKPGQIDAGLSQDEWLRAQPEWFQDSALGKTRAQLFRDGGIKIERFTDIAGQTLTLDELRALDAEAFRRAKL